jgi:CheY-like chemotaxis protein
MPQLPRPRILIVEDFFLVAQVCKAVLEKEGCTVVGPVGTVDQALALLATEDPPVDAAVLDLSLHGKVVTPVAERLQALGRPFVFLTAATDLGILPPEFRDLPRVEKPMKPADLVTALTQVGLCPKGHGP